MTDSADVGTAAPPYAPGLIEQHAVELYTRAHTARLVWGAIGAGIGLAAAAATAFLLPSTLPLPARAGFAVIVLAAGAGIGQLFGKRRSKELRVKAQLVLCDVHAQYGTLAVWRVLKERLPAAAPTWDELARPLLAAEPEPPASPVLPPVTVEPALALPALSPAPAVEVEDFAPLRAVEPEPVEESEPEAVRTEPVLVEPVAAPLEVAPQLDVASPVEVAAPLEVAPQLEQIAPPPVEPPLQPPPVLIRAAR